MWQMIARGLLAGAVVVVVTEVARQWPKVGAVILFVPLVPPLVLLSMYLKDGDLGAVSWMSRQSLVLMSLGLTFYVPLAVAPVLKMPFWGAFAAGVMVMCGAVGVYLWKAM